MKALELLRRLDEWGPVLFGLGFLAPLIAQTMEATGIPSPFDAPPIAIGLGIGFVAGVVAKHRGSWV